MFTLFFAIFIFILFLRVPYNQVRLAQYFRPKIEKAIGFPIQLRSIEFKFFNELNIHDIYIKDRQNNQMIFIKELDFNFDWSQLLFRGNRPLMTSARLIQPNVHLIQDAQTRLLNMDEFVKAIIAAVQDPNRPKNRPNALFTIKEIDIINGRFRLDINSKENESAPNHFDITPFELRNI